ncbi:MAG TPA: GWxTD domain-containing protein [Pyrinomonadaceae bacterium]|nr:GWxTD domain-containing protein [Pyrinomonadaceae bacterium]
MSKFVRLLICLGIIAGAGAVLSAGAQPKKKTPNENPETNPRKVKEELNNVEKKFVYEDAIYILTEPERKAFLALKTKEERENFIQDFWHRRDPNPDTEENEFLEEHYQRIAYANEHFSSGIPGWKTDRGRIYIRWGKPDEIESHPSGGSYDRPAYEGSGTVTAYPFETWFYRHLDGVGDGVEVEFVDPTGTGEYHIARSPNEKNALANVTGPGSLDNSVFERAQDSEFSRLERISALETPPQVKFTDLQRELGQADSGVIDKNALDFDLRVDYFRLSDNRVISAFTVQADNKELSFKPSGGLNTATINIFGRITSIANRHTGIFEDSVTTNATAEELASLQARKSAYQKQIALTPGVYKVDVIVRDIATGNLGLKSLGFTVPKYDDTKLSTSSLVLASTLRPTNKNDIGGLFVIGNHKVMPNTSGTFKKGQDLGVYLQVYNAGIDQTTLRPSIDVDYILRKDGKELSRTKEDWNGLSDSGQRLTLAKIFPTTNLTIGNYEVIVAIRDRVSTQAIENKANFTITQ